MTNGTAKAFLADLATRLPRHAAVLRRLLRDLEGQDQVVWVEIGCSIPTDRADEMSDIDMGFGYVGEAPVELVDRIIMGLSSVVDGGSMPWGEWTRWWVQYSDGVQVDVLLLPAERRSGRAPGSVALLDRTNRLAEEFTPDALRATDPDIDAWHLDGWEALGNIAKYLARGSLHEASDQLHRVRQDCCRLWAVGEGVDYPLFGLTSLLDDPAAGLPPNLEASYVPLDLGAIRAAAVAMVDVLTASAHHARDGLSSPLREWTMQRLDALDVSAPGAGSPGPGDE